MADLNALIVFAHVAESKSFSEAARRLDMPKSTVSRQVAELERDLNLTLLDRSTRGMRLTDVGLEVLEKARASVDLRDAVRDIATQHHTEVSGTLHLSSPPSISDSLLAPIVEEFQDAHPRVRVQIIITDRFVDMMAEGVDLSFIVGPLVDPTYVPRTILSYRHRLVASPAYVASHAPVTHPTDLHQHRLYSFSFWTPDHTWRFSDDAGRKHVDFRFRPTLSINDYFGIIPPLLSGKGIGELPPLVRAELLRGGKLVEVLPAWRLPTFNLKIVHQGNRYISRAVRAFVALAAERAPLLFPHLAA